MARKPKRDLTVEEQLARGPLDLPFLMLTMLLLGVGLIMMFSASFATAYYNDGDPLVYIKNQAVYAAAGVVVMFLVSRSTTRLSDCCPYLASWPLSFCWCWPSVPWEWSSMR